MHFSFSFIGCSQWMMLHKDVILKVQVYLLLTANIFTNILAYHITFFS